MPSTSSSLLPLWDSDSSANSEKSTMILISVPPALESALRAVVRYVRQERGG